MTAAAPPPPIHDEALRAFVADYEMLGRLSARSSAHEIRSACIPIRRFLDPHHANMQALWSQLGNADNLLVASVIGPITTPVDFKIRCRLYVPELRVIPNFPIRNYMALRLGQPGDPITIFADYFTGIIRLAAFASVPYVMIEGESFSRYEVVQFIAYEFGHAHFVMDSPRVSRLKSLGKLRWANELWGADTGVGWIGPAVGTGDDAAKELARQITTPFDDHELTTWLLLQIAKDIIDSPNVADLCVQVKTKLLLAPPRGRSRID